MSIPAQESKLFAITNPVSIKDDTAWVTNEIDTLGFEYCVIYLMLGASDIALALFKVREADTSGGSFSDVTGAVFGTSDNISGSVSTLPSATDDDKIFAIELDLRGLKRFLDLNITAGDGAVGTFACAWAELTRAHAHPVTAADRGCSQILRV